MGFSENIFGKNIYDININDILSFFNTEQEESSVIEFKSGDCEIEHLYREVSAFLNTEGGLLIVGAPKETKNSAGKKICIGAPNPSRFKSKDFIYQKLASYIVPMPANIKIQEIPHDNGIIYILDIPQSKTPPHQVTEEGKYYIRLEREAKPCPHGIVQALFQQRTFPQLDWEHAIYENGNDNFDIELTITNNSSCTADSIAYRIETLGVSFVKTKHGSHEEVDEIDGMHIIANMTKTYLIKEMSLTIKLEMRPLNSLMLVYMSCVSKNSITSSNKIILFDASKKEVVKTLDAEESQDLIDLVMEDIRKIKGQWDLPI